MGNNAVAGVQEMLLLVIKFDFNRSEEPPQETKAAPLNAVGSNRSDLSYFFVHDLRNERSRLLC